VTSASLSHPPHLLDVSTIVHSLQLVLSNGHGWNVSQSFEHATLLQDAQGLPEASLVLRMAAQVMFQEDGVIYVPSSHGLLLSLQLDSIIPHLFQDRSPACSGEEHRVRPFCAVPTEHK
jgi:hypothetical protein